MPRKHFFESLERENNYQHEYLKLEKMAVCEHSQLRESVERWIEENFRDWSNRGSFISFQELREHLGFSYYMKGSQYVFSQDVDINKYFLYCEMIINLSTSLHNKKKGIFIWQQLDNIMKTMRCVIEKAGFEIKYVEPEYLIVEKNAIAIEVADQVPELKDVIIEYNHYLLQGDMERKKELLKRIADSLEPKRKLLTQINRHVTDDFFFLVNNMNIRHNNCDPNNAKYYNVNFANLSAKEQENWYDLIYEQSLSLFVLLEQEERNSMIDAFKKL